MDRLKNTFWGLAMLLASGVGLHVTIPQSTYEVARGDEVVITCTFQPKNPVNPLVIISWTGDPDESFDDEGISFGTFYSNDNHVDIDASYDGKAQIQSDVNGKVSKLILKQATLRESRRIKCRVQIPGDSEGQTSSSTSLVVLVAPSNPICRIKGSAVYGQNINLTCISEEGSPPPVYKWQSYSVENAPRPFPIKAIEKDGVLSLFNVSRETSGYYVCTSSNKIRSAQCNLTLSVMPATMDMGATIGFIGGSIAGIAVLIVIVYCCCCKNKEKPEELHMGSQVMEYHDIPNQEKNKTEALRKSSIEGRIDQEKYEGERYETGRMPNPMGSEDRDQTPSSRHDYNSRRPDEQHERNDDGRDRYTRHRNEDTRDRYDNQDHYDEHHQHFDQNHHDNRQDGYNDHRSNISRQDYYDDRRDHYDDDSRNVSDNHRRHHDHPEHNDHRGRCDDQRDRSDDRRDNKRYDRYNDQDRYNY